MKLKADRNTIAFWHLHPAKGGKGQENEVLTNRGRQDGQPFADRVEGDYDTDLSRFLGTKIRDQKGGGYPTGLPALLTTPTGRLLFFPRPAAEPTVAYPIDGYQLSKYLEPGRRDRLSTTYHDG